MQSLSNVRHIHAQICTPDIADKVAKSEQVHVRPQS